MLKAANTVFPWHCQEDRGGGSGSRAQDAQFFELYRTKSGTKTYWHRTLGVITRNQHVLHYIHAGEIDPLAAHFICPIDEDSYTLLPLES